MNGSPRHVGMSVLSRVEYDRALLWVYHTALKGKNTVYTVKLWDGAHSILKFVIFEPQLKTHKWPEALENVLKSV